MLTRFFLRHPPNVIQDCASRVEKFAAFALKLLPMVISDVILEAAQGHEARFVRTLLTNFHDFSFFSRNAAGFPMTPQGFCGSERFSAIAVRTDVKACPNLLGGFQVFLLGVNFLMDIEFILVATGIITLVAFELFRMLSCIMLGQQVFVLADVVALRALHCRQRSGCCFGNLLGWFLRR